MLAVVLREVPFGRRRGGWPRLAGERVSGQDSEAFGEFAEFWAWTDAGELEQVAGDGVGYPVGAGLLGGEAFGFLEVVECLADLAAHRVGGGQVDEEAGPAFG